MKERGTERGMGTGKKQNGDRNRVINPDKETWGGQRKRKKKGMRGLGGRKKKKDSKTEEKENIHLVQYPCIS